MAKTRKVDAVKSWDDLKLIVATTILEKNKRFDYSSIAEEIKSKLREKQVDENIVESFQLEYMICATLENMVILNKLIVNNHWYTPVK